MGAVGFSGRYVGGKETFLFQQLALEASLTFETFPTLLLPHLLETHVCRMMLFVAQSYKKEENVLILDLTSYMSPFSHVIPETK